MGCVKRGQVHPSALVIRTNFFGWGPPHRPSFSDFVINSLTLGKRVGLFSDVFFTPLLIQLLVEEVHELIDLDLAGIYNVVGDERLSKFDFGRQIANFVDLDSSLIVPQSISESPRVLRRLQPLRRWSYEQTNKVFPGAARASDSHGLRAA